MKIEVGKCYATRDGQIVRIVAHEPKVYPRYPYVGVILDDHTAECSPALWSATGRADFDNARLGLVRLDSVKRMDERLLPAWANWYAMDLDGTWNYYWTEPYPSGGEWLLTDNAVGYSHGLIPPKYAPTCLPGVGWRDSLVKVNRR